MVKAVEEIEALRNSETETVANDNWLESDNYFTCESCCSLSVLEIPHNLRGIKKSNFGIVSKGQAKFHWRKALILHENNPLHMWCMKKRKELAENKLKETEVNLKAATLVATNAALCLKTFGSSVDFVRLNDKDNLTEGLLIGGGLSLCNNVAKVLGLEPGDITGNHDMSHNIQLVYTDVFKHERTGDSKIKKIIDEVYFVMADYNTG